MCLHVPWGCQLTQVLGTLRQLIISPIQTAPGSHCLYQLPLPPLKWYHRPKPGRSIIPTCYFCLPPSGADPYSQGQAYHMVWPHEGGGRRVAQW